MRVLFLAGFFLLSYRAFRRRHFIRALLAAVLGIWLVRYFQPISDWLRTLGTDSLGEVQKFAWDEALFFVQTLSATLVPMHWDRVLVLVAFSALAAAAVVVVLGWMNRRFPSSRWWRGLGAGLTAISVAFIVLPVSAEVAKLVPQFKLNSTVYAGARKNFEGNVARVQVHESGPRGMRVVVYIGEATTSMHWGLYGYPLSTTPKLAAFAQAHPGFLKFHHVVSTHTQTSQSLLEALSIGLPGGSQYRQITERPRASLVGILNTLDVPTLLMSTQGATGTWNLASSIIFSKVTSQVYATAAAALGRVSTEGEGTQVWDGAFFKDALQKFNAFHPRGEAVAFLHSYAGHGAYAANIPPEARLPQESFLKGVPPRLIYGDAAGSQDGEGWTIRAEQKIKSLLDRSEDKQIGTLDAISDYDNVMRYIDSNLAHLFQQVSQDPQPTVALYFPDHGESPATGVGHDASRFQVEMMRIPFLMYFNPAARQLNPALFAQFQAAAQAGKPSTLEQVPATILALLGYRVSGGLFDYRGIGLDPDTMLPPVVVRRLADETVYFRSHGPARQHRKDAVDATGPAATLWLNRRAGAEGRGPLLCYENANTWAKANRGALVSNCLAATLIERDGKLDVAPAPHKDFGWALRAVTRVATAHHLKLWLDAGQLSAARTCALLDPWLAGKSAAPTGGVPGMIPAGGASGTIPADNLVVNLSTRPGESFPSACSTLQARGVSFFVDVPQSEVAGTQQSSTWARTMSALGWPPHYSLHAQPDPPVLAALLSQVSDSRWALRNVPVSRLPWPTAGAGEDARFLLLQTSWDPNSRH